VLLNLFNNAYDAVASHSERWVRLEARADGPEVEISVTDSGDGIPEAVRAKMFQPFFTTKAVGQGTGIGLSISCGIVAGHRGTLEVDTHSAHTRFVLRLPRRQAQLREFQEAA
jgi:two-component system sensor histidine kinase HupT/HoxJ